MISILVTAYNNTLYIKQALDSIVESCGELEFEILVGIDNCSKTLDYLNSIRKSLSTKIKILFFTKKSGTYIIRNTLALHSKYENLIFFDSDDVMRKPLVNEVLKHLNNYEYVRYGYQVFNGELTLPLDGNIGLKNKVYHTGTFGIKKNIFMDFNGFEPWICAADGEFYWRVVANNKKIISLNIVGLFYRRHNNNLTLGSTTGMGSPLRKEYHKKKEEKQKNNKKQPLDKLTISDCIEVNEITIHNLLNYFKSIDKNYDNNKKLSIIIPTYKNTEFLFNCLDSIISSIGNLNCEILIGIDGCEETLKVLKNFIFNERTRLFYFENNLGPYIIKNSLSKIANSDNLLFFDSDDIMLDNLISESIEVLKTHKMYKPKYFDFININEIKNPENLNSNNFGEGVFAIDKKTFLSLNGFEGWRCAADSDFMSRFYKRNISFTHGQKVSFLRRIHPNSLTSLPETNYSSKLRAHYYSLSKKPRPNGVCEKFETYPFIPVDVNYHQNFQDYENNFKEKLEIEKQKERAQKTLSSVRKNTNQQRQPVDYDRLNKILHSKKVYVPKEQSKKPKIIQNVPQDRNKLIEIKKNSNLDALRSNLKGKPNRRNNLPNIFGKK